MLSLMAWNFGPEVSCSALASRSEAQTVYPPPAFGLTPHSGLAPEELDDELLELEDELELEELDDEEEEDFLSHSGVY